ncbi:MAG: Flp pilus assembly complex ATPase component TadA [Actinomycetota bacterium]|nr:Flp pilus assembly complex ATPase component TadA [Actinomycetota bacterium]
MGATNAYEEIRSDVLAHLERAKLDPKTDLDGVRQAVVAAVEGYQVRAHLGEGRALRDPADMVGRVLTSITGFGPLTELLTRPDIEEVFIEGARVSYLDAMGHLQGLSVPTSEAENRQIIDRLLSTTQRHLDAQNPIVQARVLDGKARLSAAIPPVADRLSATIRRHILRKESIHSLVERESLTPAAASFLWATMQTATSLVVAGPPGAGKTSLLAALMSAVPSNHCIRCCEEIRELSIPITHGAYYEARPPALDGSGEIPLRELVKFILAMRPDRIVVGEVRGAEASRFGPSRDVMVSREVSCTVPSMRMRVGSRRVASLRMNTCTSSRSSTWRCSRGVRVCRRWRAVSASCHRRRLRWLAAVPCSAQAWSWLRWRSSASRSACNCSTAVAI